MIRAALALVVLALAPALPAAAAGPETGVTRLPAEVVGSAFAKGMPLLETAAYKIHASRREMPGMAEVHVLDTDIIHVLEGRAAFVTGGRVVGGKEIAPGEIRGASIDDGDVRELAPGDVLVVPAGVPHWFRDVQGPLLYFVVKVTDCDGGAR